MCHTTFTSAIGQKPYQYQVTAEASVQPGPPSPCKRLGAALAFNSIYVVFRYDRVCLKVYVLYIKCNMISVIE